MNNIHLALAILGALTAVPASADEQRINVSVGELTCPTCSFTVAAAMRGVSSVEIIDFQEGSEFGKGTYMVAYDDQVANPGMIVDAILATGYPAKILQPNDS